MTRDLMNSPECRGSRRWRAASVCQRMQTRFRVQPGDRVGVNALPCVRRRRSFAPMTKPPLVSVVIPTHNRPDMLREAIASVRAQTFTDYEILVVCNGSSQEDLVRYGAIRDVRLVVTSRKGIGLALNIGIKAARGEWVAFLDDDDLWEPNKLENQLQAA